MTDRRLRSEEEAVAWVMRLKRAGPEEWEAFTAWLEADPAHLEAYDEAALADADAEGLAPAAAPEVAERPRRHVLGWGMAAAACVAGLIAFAAIPAGADLYEVATGPGQHRRVDLADGSRIELNGGTRLRLDRANARFAALDSGEALFTIRHDAAHPFEVETGGTRLRDMGTVFNVVAERGALEVGVSEGRVRFDPDGAATDLTPGMQLSRAAAGARPLVTRVETDAIGGWQAGRLSYHSATLTQVAADLSRNLGMPVRADPGLARQSFTGVIILGADRPAALARAAALMGLSASRSGDGWVLRARGRATP